MAKYLLAYGLSLVLVSTFSLSISAQAPVRRPPDPLLSPPERIIEVPLDEPDRPSPSPIAPISPSPVELEATKIPRPQLLIPRREAAGLGIVILILSLLGNAFQFYRQRLYGKTTCNELVSTFNSVAWLLARCMNKTKELDERAAAEKADDPALLKEFREFSVDTEFILRALREQLVAVAKNLRSKDKTWKAGQFGHTPEEVGKIRGAFTERPEREF